MATYADLDYAFSPFTQTGTPGAQSSPTNKFCVAIGIWCYNVLVEAATTTNHAARVRFALSMFGISPWSRPWARLTYMILIACPNVTNGGGVTTPAVSASDADIQVALNQVLDNLAAATV